MIRKTLLFVLILALIPIVRAGVGDDIYQFIECDGGVTDKSGNNHNAIDNGITYTNDTFCEFAKSTADFVDLNHTFEEPGESPDGWTIELHARHNIDDNDFFLWYGHYTAGTDRVEFWMNDGAPALEDWSFYFGGVSQSTFHVQDLHCDGCFQSMVVVHNKTSPFYYMYVNGSEVAINEAGVYNYSTLTFTRNMYLGCSNRGSCTYPHNITVDKFVIYSRPLTPEEINQNYNNGQPLTFDQRTGESPLLTVLTSLTTGSYTDNPLVFWYNGTVTNTSDIFDCVLYLNDSLQENQTSVNVSLNQNFTLNTTGWETGYDMNISCTNDDASDSVLVTDVQIDTIQPDIDNAFTDNRSYFRGIDPDINVTVNYSDTNLYAINFSIFRLNTTGNASIDVMNNTFVEGIIDSLYTVNYSAPLSNYTTGRFWILLEAWDSHTANELKSKAKIKDNNLEYRSASFYCDDTKIMDYVEEIDRIKPKVKFKTKKTEQVCYYEVPGLQAVEASPYPNHYVSLDAGIWIDEYAAQVDQVSSNKIKLTFSDAAPFDEITTDSIGDLNYLNVSYYFNVSESFILYAVDTFTNTTITNFSILILNGSDILENTSTISGNITTNITTGSYAVNITAPNYADNSTSNLTFSENASHTFSLFAENSLYLFFYDEETDTLINDTLTVQVLSQSSANEYNTTAGTLFISGFSVGDYEIRYGGGQWRTRAYFTAISDSSTQQIDLYSVKNASSSLTIFGITNEKGNPLYNYTLIGYRHMIADNAYLVIEMERTDTNGETAMYLVPNDVFYQFTVTKGNDVVFVGSPRKIFDTQVQIKVNTLVDVFESIGIMRDDVTRNLTWDNETEILSYFWSGPAGKISEGCLYVEATTWLGVERVAESCTAANTATITINMSGIAKNKTSYTAKAYIDTNTTSSTYYTDIIDGFIRAQNTYQLFGKHGLYVAWLLILTMFFMGLLVRFSHAVIYTSLAMLALQLVGVSYFGWALIAFASIGGFVVAVVVRQ